MKIGIFDSGLGGLMIMKAIAKKLPDYDLVYLGDTKRVPYGNRSQEVVYEFAKQGVEFLFKKNCQLIILACNTASTQALRRLQREYLPKHYPNRRILGVIVPTVEEAIAKQYSKVGVLATTTTVNSNSIPKQFRKYKSGVKVYQQSAPLLAALVENEGLKWVDPILKNYLKPLLKNRVNVIMLCCTHYGMLKRKIEAMVGLRVSVLSQNDIIPIKLKLYLKKHFEIDKLLSKNSSRQIFVTDMTPYYKKLAGQWFEESAKLKLIKL